MKKILVPTDFSKASEHAAKYAFGLAKDLWADIHFIHVYQPPLLLGDPLTYGGAVGYLSWNGNMLGGCRRRSFESTPAARCDASP